MYIKIKICRNKMTINKINMNEMWHGRLIICGMEKIGVEKISRSKRQRDHDQATKGQLKFNSFVRNELNFKFFSVRPVLV